MKAKRKLATVITEDLIKYESSHALRKNMKLTVDSQRYQVRNVYGLENDLGFNRTSSEGDALFNNLLSENVVARASMMRLSDGQGFIILEYKDGSFSWPEDLGMKVGTPENRAPEIQKEESPE